MPFHLWIVVVLMLLAAIAVGVVVVAGAALGMTHHNAAPSGPAGAPLDILARRFAAGEISADEYQKARDLLQGGSSKGS